MKKIINGLIYDTETAVRIGYYDNGCNSDHPGFHREELYKKPNGYFLHYTGKINDAADNVFPYTEMTINSEDIIVLDLNAAKKWGIKHMTKDEYLSEFEFINLIKAAKRLRSTDN